jgi:hypothetical protein
VNPSDERDPIHVRALAALLGVVVCKDLLTAELTHNFLIEPDQFYLGFIDGLPRLPPSAAVNLGQLLVCVLCFVAALALGRGSRVAALCLMALYGASLLWNALEFSSNLYLLVLLLGVCGVARLHAPSVLWPRRLGQITISAVYLGAGLGKLEPNVLSGRALEATLYHYNLSSYPQLVGWRSPALFCALSWFTVATELGLAFALWHPRAFRWAAALGVCFHVSIAALLPVRIFSELMVASYVLFMPGSQLVRAQAWVARRIRPALRAPACVVLALGLHFLDPFAVERPRSFVALGVALGMHMLWRPRERPAPEPPKALARIGPAIVYGYLVLQAFAIAKPWLGFSKFGSWRMFSEVLTMRVETEVLQAGRWQKAIFKNRSQRWSRKNFDHYWTSLGEERFYLLGYQRWLARQYDLSGRVRLAVHYSLFEGERRDMWIGPE